MMSADGVCAIDLRAWRIRGALGLCILDIFTVDQILLYRAGFQFSA